MIFPPSSHGLRLVRNSLGWQPGQAHFEPVSFGRHARVFKVSCGGAEPIALKEYAPDFRTSETLEREFLGLRLLERFGIVGVPKALEQDKDRGVAMYRWEAGTPLSPTDHDEDVFDRFIDFLGSCARIPAREFPRWSSTAVRSGISLETRLRQRLEQIPRERDELRMWLESELSPTADELLTKARETLAATLRWDEELTQERRILAPAHLGFGNTLETPSRQLVFLNHSGFGQDDPASILARILVNGSDAASPDQKSRLIHKFFEHFGTDPHVGTRFAVWYLLVGLDQIMDHLDPFIPMDRVLREFAGLPSHPKEEVLAKALNLAKRALEALQITAAGN